ncbi:MAG: FMN-binding protein [Candidatus Neomarinimicrobiota bacterium]
MPRISDRRNANVDAITGATTTSKSSMKAVEQALMGK